MTTKDKTEETAKISEPRNPLIPVDKRAPPSINPELTIHSYLPTKELRPVSTQSEEPLQTLLNHV